MFFRTNSLAAKLRRVFSVDEWMVRLLRLSVIKEQSAQPGVVIIQVDGLSHTEFTHAMHKNEMPHLKWLLKREKYAEYVHYSGQPSCTPAVQGELFYGVKNCVPAFSFKDKKTKKIFNMFNPSHASEIEKRIKNSGAPLLKDGSAYGNIFTGGAKEAHFCVSAIGWDTLLSAANPIAIIVFTLMHLHIIIRAGMLTILEGILAMYDSLRGYAAGKDLFHEIRYIPFRVIACVIIREIIGIGAKIDIARGMPVIHVNLAGYDEQAHHRGPKSKFAHWSLRAIDSVIKIIWRAAKRSSHRDYDVIVYSDHGQEDTITYKEVNKKTVQEAVNEVLRKELSLSAINPDPISRGGYMRGDLLRGKPLKNGTPEMEWKNNSGQAAVITALGPLGHIYLPDKLSGIQKENISQLLITHAKIPLVMFPKGRGMAHAWNAEGKFILPRDAAKVLGEEHPFLYETARDLAALCGHKDSGEIIISGLRKEGKSITFYNEHGSHAGPGPHETAGFAIFPPDVTLPDKKTIYNDEIREAVFRSLKRGGHGRFEISKTEAKSKEQVSIKIMSYNIHACMGLDGKVQPERIAKVIANHNPDIVALQEIDAGVMVHQAEEIAQLLSMNFYYHSSVMLKNGLHGNAIFSRFKLNLIKKDSLPSLVNIPFLEKRGALWVEADVHGRKVQIINTHLSLFPPEGMLQIKNILSSSWIGGTNCKDPVVLCGDFNASLDSGICRAVEKEFSSIKFDLSEHGYLKSSPGLHPLGLVDHIFLGPGVKAVKIETSGTGLEKTASDHLPLIAELVIKGVKKDSKDHISAISKIKKLKRKTAIGKNKKERRKKP